MRSSTLFIISALFVTAAPALTSHAVAAGAGKGAEKQELQSEVQALRTDIEAIRTAHQGKDKAGTQAGLVKLKSDWDATSAPVKQRIEEKRPELFEKLSKHLKLSAPTPATPPAMPTSVPA